MIPVDRVSGSWYRLPGYVLPVVLAFASLSKVTAWLTWVDSVESYTVLAPRLRDVMLWSVPVLELMPVLMLSLGWGRFAGLAGLALLGAFTGGTVWQFTTAQPPTCACFGEWLALEISQSSIYSTLLRNAAFAVVGICGIVLWNRGSNSAPTKIWNDAH